MSPRSSVAQARRTRAGIVDRAVYLASLEGLERVTMGRLAADLRMSKSGVLGHFGTKQALQLAALQEAVDLFSREVWEPGARAAEGLARLVAIGEAWVSYLERDVFPGGCFLTAASCEFDGRPGPVRDAVRRALSRWRTILEREATLAIESAELPAGLDPGQIAFELGCVAVGLNQELQLHHDREAPRRARRAVARMLGVAQPAPGACDVTLVGT